MGWLILYLVSLVILLVVMTVLQVNTISNSPHKKRSWRNHAIDIVPVGMVAHLLAVSLVKQWGVMSTINLSYLEGVAFIAVPASILWGLFLVGFQIWARWRDAKT